MSSADLLVVIAFIVAPIVYVAGVSVILWRVCTLLEPLVRAAERAERARELADIEAARGRLQ